MAQQLPPFMVIQGLLYATTENTGGYVTCSEKNIFNTYVKIAVEVSTVSEKYVHLRFAATNKYFAKDPDGFIKATSDQVEEDTSKESCTLFEPYVYSDSEVEFDHVQSGGGVQYHSRSDHRLTVGEPGSGRYTLNFVDWETLVTLPKRVSFKADNGKYIMDYWPDNYPFLTARSEEPNLESTSFEIYPQSDGYIRVKSLYYNKYWCYGGGDWIASYSEDESGNNIKTLFWPVKVDDHNNIPTIALLCAANKKFVQRVSNSSMSDSLCAQAATISNSAKLVVQEQVLRKVISNTRYRMEDARIVDETPFVAATLEGENASDTESSQTLAQSYKEKTSSSFTNNESLTMGGSVEFTVSVPFIVDSTIKFSAEVTSSREWNTTEEEETSIAVAYTTQMPARSKVRVDYVGTRGTCNIPFSYIQRDKSSTDGKITTTQHVDGVYNGVSCYNYHFTQPRIRSLLEVDE